MEGQLFWVDVIIIQNYTNNNIHISYDHKHPKASFFEQQADVMEFDKTL